MRDFWKQSNFAAMRKKSEKVYYTILAAEQHIRFDLKTCSISIREAMETFANEIFEKKPELCKYLTSGMLADKLNVLADQSVIMRLERVEVEYKGQRKTIQKKVEGLTFIRNFGNAGHHANDGKTLFPAMTYANALLALKLCHTLFIAYYDLPRVSFDESTMPIGKYFICDVHYPSDQSLSGCAREYIGVEVNERADVLQYAIIREYNGYTQNIDFLARNFNANMRIINRPRRQIPEGVVSTVEVFGPQIRNGEYTPFYLIAYRFNRMPYPLTAAYLSNLSWKQRCELCADLISIVKQLHEANEPIFLRLLSYESVMICDEDAEYVPYIVKFDFAKLINEPTIIDLMKEKSEKVNEVRRRKYLAPEWENAFKTDHPNWEQIDIYALGVLVGDILMGRIGVKVVTSDDLPPEASGMGEVVDLMTAEDPQERSNLSLHKVLLAFGRED